MTSNGLPKDLSEGRVGEWMHTSLGGRFFPADPRAEDIHISDIANGLALDCRYAGQGRVDRYYSVAEHCTLMAWYARDHDWPPLACLAVLLHDAAEAYLNDLPRAVKQAVSGYKLVEVKIERLIWEHFGVDKAIGQYADRIKVLDCRMVPLEKRAVMRYPQPWAYDDFEPLEGVEVKCWGPVVAKLKFLQTYDYICEVAGVEPEEWEI